jgi:WD40 repeat protein
MSEDQFPPPPYIGLVPFQEKDAPFFFGRESERKIISANLLTRRLTVLYGPSGVGKSSVINAGVVYHLHQHDQQISGLVEQAEAVSSHPANESGEFAATSSSAVVIVFSEWVGNPLKSLQEAILTGLRESSHKTPEPVPKADPQPPNLLALLYEVTKSNEDLELFVILDQFEEYFVYHPDAEGPKQFADQFSRAVISRELRVNFLISIREDWLARLDRFKGRIPNLFDNSIRVEHLGRKAAREAIVKPVEKYNELRKRERAPGGAFSKVEITDEFVDEVLDQLEQLDDDGDKGVETLLPQGALKSDGQRIQPSRLQVVLEHLWNKVKNEAKPTFGVELLPKPDTVKCIIESNLRETLEHLSWEEKVTAANLFRFLITESGTKFASTVDGLAARSGRPASQIRPVVEKLSGNVRILKRVAGAPSQSNQVRYELTSDVLAAPILAWGQEVFAKRRRKQNRGWYILASLIMLFIIIIAGAFLRARQQRQAANEQRQAANEQARVLEIERAKAQRALDAVRKLDDRVPYSKKVLRGHGAKVMSAVFTPNENVLTASEDGSAILWDIESKDPIHEFNKNEKEELGLVCAAVSPKGDSMVTANADGTVALWRLPNGPITKTLRERVGHHVTAISFSPTGDFIAAANTVGEVLIWQSDSGELVKDVPENGKAIRRIAFSPFGTFLAAASDDHSVRIWRAADWSEANPLVGHTDRVNGIAFSPDEKTIATAGRDTTVRVWEVSSGKNFRVLRGHAQGVNSVDFDSGNRLLTASDDTTARIWDIETSKSISLIGHTDKVLTASFSPNGQQVVTAGRDWVARIWSASTGTSLVELRGHLDQITYVTYSSDGKYVLTASDDATARVWFANQSGNFEIEQPQIGANPKFHPGDCPVTISFLIKISARSGGGTVVYRLKGSDGRIWPVRELAFDEPGVKYINWYWRLNKSYSGSETIEIIEPKGLKEQKAIFTVKCNKSESAEPSPSPTPSATPSP